MQAVQKVNSLMCAVQDMGLATAAATQLGTAIPLGEAAETLYAQMIESNPGLGRKDFSSVYRFLESVVQEEKKLRDDVSS